MKKIKDLNHLQKERQRLRRRELELQDAIRNEWNGLRQSINPGVLATQALSSCTGWLGRKLFKTKN